MAVTRWMTLALAAGALACCARPPERLAVLTGATMGTRYTVRLVDPDRPGAAAGELRGEIEALLARIDASMSTYRDGSELTRFNVTPSTEWVSVSSELYEVLDEALRIGAMTDGAFDVTVGPLVNLWGFGPEPGPDAVPGEEAIAAARARVGLRFLATRAQPPAVRKARPDVYVDLSAIAKGYAVDRVAALIDAHGLTRYLVEIGGELRTRGRNEQGGAWTVAVEQPLAGERQATRLLHVDGAAVATSGGYRNFFELDGRRYSHIIDPRSGRPVTHDLVSVTVVAESAVRADALATGLMVLGPESGYATALREGLAALFIRRAGEGFLAQATPALARYDAGRPLRPQGSSAQVPPGPGRERPAKSAVFADLTFSMTCRP